VLARTRPSLVPAPAAPPPPPRRAARGPRRRRARGAARGAAPPRRRPPFRARGVSARASLLLRSVSARASPLLLLGTRSRPVRLVRASPRSAALICACAAWRRCRSCAASRSRRSTGPPFFMPDRRCIAAQQLRARRSRSQPSAFRAISDVGVAGLQVEGAAPT
jgi:hypothetical protein